MSQRTKVRTSQNTPRNKMSPKLKVISEKAYRDSAGLNKSLLVPFMRSPKHYLHELNNPKKATDSMNLGTALHAQLLRPEIADSIYAVLGRKIDKRKTADKEYFAQFEADNKGKIILDEEQKYCLDSMTKAVLAHPAAKRLIEQSTMKEQAMFGTYKSSSTDHSFPIKALADGILPGEGIIFDIKSTEDASMSTFSKKVRAFRYDLQQVHYTFAAVCNGIDVSSFPFIACENIEPFGVAVYTLDAEKIKRTWDEWRLAMDFYAHCHAKQDFEISYSDSISNLSF